MPKCIKTGGTCTLHKNYKSVQLDHTAEEVEVQPLNPSLTLGTPIWHIQRHITIYYYEVQTVTLAVCI